MRVVLDTNVVVSALLWGGTPFQLLHAATEGQIVLATSPALLDELRSVLNRSHLTARLLSKRSSVAQAIELYSQLTLLVSPLSTPRVVPADPDDDQVIACAIAAHASIIVSGDTDLLSLNPYQRIQILSPAHAIQYIREQLG